jgi:hypothetical protein
VLLLAFSAVMLASSLLLALVYLALASLALLGARGRVARH